MIVILPYLVAPSKVQDETNTNADMNSNYNRLRVRIVLSGLLFSEIHKKKPHKILILNCV